MYDISCNGCGATARTASAADPDAALDCDCCPEKHHHGRAANETGTPCRPITITALGPAAAALRATA